MDQSTKNNNASGKEPVKVPGVEPSQRTINILQLAPWLTSATANNKNFLLKPTDLRMLYMFVLWEYLSKHHHTGSLTGDVPAILNDEQISIPEADLVRMVQMVFHNTYYPYFSRVYNM